MSTITINSPLTQGVHGIELHGKTVTLLVGCSEQHEEDSEARQCRHKLKSQCIVTKLKKNKSNASMPPIDERIFNCGSKDCGKWSHLLCFSEMINKTNTAVGYDTIIFACGLRCYKQALKQSSGGVEQQISRPMGKFWDNDRVNNGPSSMDILLEWITDSVNAEKYFGAKDTPEGAGFNPEDGLTKSALCAQISQFILARNGKHENVLISLQSLSSSQLLFL
jgi:hypothetical protein